jgi:hypothetical protein
MTIISKSLLTIFVLFSSVAVKASSLQNLRPWEVFEITLNSGVAFQNPYVECLDQDNPPYLTARNTGTSGTCKGRNIVVPGFWDGGNTWKLRFAPPSDGTWQYVTSCADRRMNRKEGEITVMPWSADELDSIPTRRGPIIVQSTGDRKGRYFTYTDGTPFFWIGDTWWDWTNRRIKFESFKNLADTRSEQSFNIGQLFFAANGWGRESSLLDATYEHPDIDQIKKVEQMIAYANYRGITVWIHPLWCREGINQKIGEDKIIRWWRYVIHRLHAYNVIWVLAGEYNMNNYGGFPLEFWNRLGKIIKNEDPYDRIVSAHPTPPMWNGGAEAPQWSTAEAIHNQSWLDYNQSQTGHARWCNELTPEIVRRAWDMVPAKPIVVTEPWYEFIKGNPTAKDIRFGAWSAIMSGAAGHSYGGGHIWKAHLKERPVKTDSWPMDTSLATNTMLYPGALSVAFMGNYLRKLNWWRLDPHPEIVIDNPSRFCLADPGREYIFYLRYGGSVKIDLTEYPDTIVFEFEWTDLVTSKGSRSGKVNGGRVVEIKCPEDYPAFTEFKDWVLHLKRDG